MTPLQVHWAQCTDRRRLVWCLLKDVDTENVNTGGVYVIWHGGHVPRVIYVGQGDIAGRVNHHRSSSRILQYGTKGLLMVTWAAVPESERRGAAKYVADALEPLRSLEDDTPPIPVNLPWDTPPIAPQ